MLNIGMISKWHVHAKDYAREISHNPNAQITAVWDEDPVRGAEWAAELGAPFYADYSYGSEGSRAAHGGWRRFKRLFVFFRIVRFRLQS